jgi:hypothetical protein
MKNLFTTIVFICILVSCEKGENIEPSTINYYLISTPSSTFKNLNFDYGKIFVQQLIGDINPGHIVENNFTVTLNLGNSDTVFLGSGQGGVWCRQCAEDSIKFEFRLITSDFKARTDTSELILNKIFNVNRQNFGAYDHKYDTVSAFLFLSEGESTDLFIELDVDKSIILDSINTDWINPKLTISKK